ncbi:hypothetical protein [Nocardiopsis synnemataformans]
MDHQGPPGEEYVERIVDEVILPALGLDPRDPSPAVPEEAGTPASSGG